LDFLIEIKNLITKILLHTRPFFFFFFWFSTFFQAKQRFVVVFIPYSF